MKIDERHHHEHPTHNFDGIVENRRNKPPIYFTVMLYGLIAWGTVFIAYFLMSGWSSTGEFQREMDTYKEQAEKRQQSLAATGTGTEKTQGDPAIGKGLYATHCSGCHGGKGEGGIGPALTRTEYKYGRTQEVVTESIRSGRPGGMPGFGTQISAEEIEHLVAFVLTLK